MFKKITALMLLLAAVAAFAIGCGETEEEEAVEGAEEAAEEAAE